MKDKGLVLDDSSERTHEPDDGRLFQGVWESKRPQFVLLWRPEERIQKSAGVVCGGQQDQQPEVWTEEPEE